MPLTVHTRGEEYLDSPAASSPGVSALHGQVDMSPFLFSCWDRGVFQTATTAFMQHIRLPRPWWAELGISLHDPFKSISISASPHCLGSKPLFSPNSSRMEDQTHPFQSQLAIRWEEIFPAGISALPGGGGDVSLKHLKSHS